MKISECQKLHFNHILAVISAKVTGNIESVCNNFRESCVLKLAPKYYYIHMQASKYKFRNIKLQNVH